MTDPDVASWPVCTWAPAQERDPNRLPGTFGGVGPVARITPYDGRHDSPRSGGQAWLEHRSESRR